MKLTGRALRTWVLGLGLFVGVAVSTSRVFAIDCFANCQDCVLFYQGCGACGGDGCSAWGAGCTEFCWSCGGEKPQCQPA